MDAQKLETAAREIGRQAGMTPISWAETPAGLTIVYEQGPKITYPWDEAFPVIQDEKPHKAPAAKPQAEPAPARQQRKSRP
jgi:hypothetical protein